MPTHPAACVLGQLVRLYLEGQECRSTITVRWFDSDVLDWFDEVSGLAGWDISAYDAHAF